MLYCKICGDEANSSATQCVLCKDYVDVKCHGGVVGDGHVVCKECTGNLDEITSGIISKEELFIEGVSKFNSKLIKDVVESKSLKLIFSGQLYSHRHNTFKKGGKHKRNMDDTCVLDLLSDGQRELIISQIMHHFGKESEMHDYYVKVLLPEAVILLLAKSMRWSRVKAEVFLGLYLQERNKDDAENLEHQSTFVGMVKEGMRNYQRQKEDFLKKVEAKKTKKNCSTNNDTDVIPPSPETMPKRSYTAKEVWAIVAARNKREDKEEKKGADGPHNEDDTCSEEENSSGISWKHDSGSDSVKPRRKKERKKDETKLKTKQNPPKKKNPDISLERMRRAERAAEREMLSESDEESPMINHEDAISTSVNVYKVKLSLKEKRKAKKQKKAFNELMVANFGDKDAVSEEYINGVRNYTYKCDECHAPIRNKLARHLVRVHKMERKEAALKQSEKRVMFLWCRSKKHNCPLPAPCSSCNEWFLRIDHHFRNHKKHAIKDEEKLAKMVSEVKSIVWDNGLSTRKARCRVNSQPTTSQLTTKPTEMSKPSDTSTGNKDAIESDNESFFYRSKPAPLPAPPAIDFLPPGAIRITQENRKDWSIGDEEFVNIHYGDASSLLTAFYDDLIQMCRNSDETNNALQHRNKVELIWSTVDNNMTMFPKNALSNLHLLRHHYHIPTFKMISRKAGVQASTLSSRYSSLNFFIQFLRKHQVFAGMSRMELLHLEKAVKDFNKELNPHIKQRKIDVRRNKTRHLLSPQHFIRYGRSKHVQNLLGIMAESKKSKKYRAKRISKKVAIEIRDYLISSLCIGNGLRASNVMELRIKDFDESKIDKKYPGHRIITNSSYKTSTIYGEKFVVLSTDLYDQCMFYQTYLRKLINSSSSRKFFLPSSPVSNKMTQTNISASLTASFKRAGIFKAVEYQRVSCTRVRCGIATFACNEGGFESAFFAKHFMKNREETTDVHYNLLSNRRHALSIAMKLYESFTKSDGSVVKVNAAEIDSITSEIKQHTAALPNKETVLKWLKDRNKDMSPKEIVEINTILGELETVSGNSLSFYGNTVNKVGLDVNNDVDDNCSDKDIDDDGDNDDNGSDKDIDDDGDVDDDGNDGDVDYDSNNGDVDGYNGYSNADRNGNDGSRDGDVDFAQSVVNDSGKVNLLYHVNDDKNKVILGKPIDDNKDGIDSDCDEKSLKKPHTCRKLYPLRDKRVYEERDTINLHGESDKGSSHNDDDYKQTKKRQVRKRKKLFDEDELKVLRKKCKRMICEYEAMTKCQIKDVLAGTNLIKKYDWKRLRTRIAYERKLFFD